MEGNTFFYVNPLECDTEYHFNRDDTITRQPWFVCSCCPTNVVRLLPSLPEYIYAVRDNRLYLNLYISSQTKIAFGDSDVEIAQESNYPWDGQIKIDVNPEQTTSFTLSLRIPSWVNGQPLPGDLYRYVDDTPGEIGVTLNGKPLSVNDVEGYINIDREWHAGDSVELELPMLIRRVISHPNIVDNVGKVALERGPIVYAAEGIDNDGQALNIVLSDDKSLEAEHRSDLLNGVTVITGEDFMAIPYYAWAHRGLSEMSVWFSREK
jgi:DUF1680 family protein